jgi:hypothetical protein
MDDPKFPKHDYKIAGLPKQILILIWKNFINSRRNIVGSLLELLCPFIFVSFLLVIRYFIEKIKLTSQFNQPTSVLDVRLGSYNQSRNVILYHPDTEFVKKLVQNAVDVIVASNPGFKPIGIFSIG